MLRNIKRHKVYSFINIIGLAIGMACCILILLWVQDELSFDKFHEHADELYWVPTWQQYGNDRITASGAPPALGPALKEDYPAIVNSARYYNGQAEMLVQHGEKRFMEMIHMADLSFFEMFTFPVVKGSYSTAFSDPHVIVITEDKAVKLFGDEESIGKILTLDNQYDFRIIGIVKNIPHNSTLQFDFLVPLEFVEELWGESISNWSDCSYRTFIQLRKNVPFEEVSGKITGRIKKENENSNAEPFLFPFSRAHLYSLSGRGGRIQEVRIFTLVASFILIIACINFMNLTTARSAKRAREVGLRKVVGANRRQLIRQFFSESILFSFIAFFIAVFLVELFLPSFSKLTGKPLTIDYSGNFAVLGGIVCIAFLTGILSGSYPALLLSAFQPVNVLKGTSKTGSRTSSFRKLLVVTQFAISIILIIGTTVVCNQLHFMRNLDLGFEKDFLIHVPVKGNLEQNYDSVKNELLKNPGILNVTMSSHSPTGIWSNSGGWDWEGKNPDVDPLVTELVVDSDFLKTFHMKMEKGRFFSREFSREAFNVIINERFAEIMGLESPVGKRLAKGSFAFNIIGVIKDFHFKPLDRNIEPIIISSNTEFDKFEYMFIQISSKNIPQTIAFLEKTTQKFNPGFPFEFHFLDDDYDRLYRAEQRTDKIIRYFAFLAIFISCLGLFGLGSFTAEQRTKEIGIRKVLGASESGIIVMLSKEFTKWVLLANIIAWPIAYFAMNRWLQNFVYHIDIGWWTFILAGGLALVIALATVSYQSIKAALANPADSLRYE